MRYPGILALAAFLAACTPAGMAPPTGPIPVTPEAAASPAAATTVAPTASMAPAAGAVAADEQVVEFSGQVMAPEGVHAPGVAKAAGLHLMATGEKPVGKAPVQFLDPITNEVVGQTTADDQGQYKLRLGVKTLNGGKTLKVSVDLVGKNGKPLKLFSLTRVSKEDGPEVTGVDINSATHVLTNRYLAKADFSEKDFVRQEFLTAAERLDAALRSADLDKLDLSDPVALSNVLKDILEGDTTLAELVKGLDGDDEGEESDDEDTGSSSSGGGGSNNDDDDEAEEEDDATDVDDDDEATDSDDDDAPTPILSGTIK